jgi:hypothetical protein
MSKFHEKNRELQALQCFGFMNFSVFFWDIAVFKNAFPIDSANPDFSAANQVLRMGKLVKRACAHLWYSKLDSTGNKS